MESIIIKLIILMLFFLNIQLPSVSAKEEVSQLFYMYKGEPVEHLEENLKKLEEEKIPVILAMDSEKNIHAGQVKQLQKLQDKFSLNIILQQKNDLNQTTFVTKGYDEEIKLAGVYEETKKELIYTGEKIISFKKINLSKNPINIPNIKERLSDKKNYAICVDEQNFNISNILFIDERLKESPLKIDNYIYEIEEPEFIYRVFTYIGDISIVLFSFAIVVFLVAIFIFKKWSLENFFD